MSDKKKIPLKVLISVLLELGHGKLYLKRGALHSACGMESGEIKSWDDYVLAKFNWCTHCWEIQSGVNGIYENVNNVIPNGVEELDSQSYFQVDIYYS